MSKVGSLIRKIRKEKALTQRALAKIVGVVDSCIKNYELGYRTPNEAKRIKIAESLGVNKHYFLEPVYPYSKEDLMRFLLKLDDTLKLKLIYLDEVGYAITFDKETNRALFEFFIVWEKVKLLNDMNQKVDWKRNKLNEL